MVYKFSDKKSSGSDVTTDPNYQLANGLHRQIIRELKRQKVYSSFRDNILGVDLADMQTLANTTKESSAYYVQLICLVNMHSLFL